MEKLSTIQQINSAIMFGNLSNVELNSIADAVKYARAQMTKQQTRSLRIGDTVKFTSNRDGITYNGTVDKIKLKFVHVRTSRGLFNVPANMLEAV
jgi:ASC-1-like (ASCH) protein